MRRIAWGSPSRFAGGLFRNGRADEILSRNGVDVTPVERVQRWEDTLWKARLVRPRSHP